MVERAAVPRIPVVRRRLAQLAKSMTTPLVPDDYLGLLDPRWSAKELTGTVVRVKPESPECATVVIRPSFPWPGHKAGQYLRIGAEVDGVRQWRAYTITSDPDHPEALLSVTIKRVEEGLMSNWFLDARPETVVFLGDVEGTFRLPDPVPAKALCISAGSGVTPIWAVLREMDRRAAIQDVVHLHGTRTSEGFIFGDDLRSLAERRDGYRLHEQISSSDGRMSCEGLDELCPDWRERFTLMSGPRDMIDAFVAHYEEAGLADQIEVERFQPVVGTGDAETGSGGTVKFRVKDVEARCEPGVSILVGGEEAGAILPFGCRMGICHTCVGKLCEGQVRDVRTGELHGDVGKTIRTCVNAPEGHVEIEL